MALLCVAAFLGVASAMGARPSQRATRLESYSFAQFTEKYSRTYAAGSAEYKRREEVFQASLSRIHAVNAKNARENRPWRSDIHPFMDWTEVERKPLNSGYKSKGGRRHGRAGFLSLLSAQASTSSQSATRAKLNQTARLKMREHPRIRNQGDCGSCWAISAVEAVEAQLLQSGIDVQLSAQALIDCVPNPRHCGGKGGCDGATVELGMNWAMSNGLATEAMDPYETRETECSKTVAVSLGEGELDGDGRILATPSLHEAGRGGAAAFGLTGFWTLEKNKEAPLIQAVVEHGPVAVSVSAESWFSYHSGVFNGCPKNSVVDHAVTLFGYGNAGQSHRYWLIRNSWGPDWGESGFIRLLRHEDEESHCGIDDKPKLGVACDGAPEQVTVCGSCGILYDSVIPRFQKHREAATSLSDETEVATGETESSTESESEEPASMLQQAADEKEGQEEPDVAGRSMLQGKEADAAGSGDALNVTVASAALKSVQASGEVSAAAAKLSPSQARMAASIKAKAYEAAGYEVQADGTLHKSSKAKATPSNLMRRDAAR